MGDIENHGVMMKDGRHNRVGPEELQIVRTTVGKGFIHYVLE